MNSLTKKKSIVYISIGLLLNALGLILLYYTADSGSYDFWIGALQGTGITIILIALAKGSFRKPAAKQ
ncbi:MAG: hypothetical protein WBL21_11995 [Salinimicrobium sp.]